MPKKSSTLFSRSYLDRNDYSFTVKLSPELSVNIFSAVLHAPHHVLSALSPSPRHTKGAHLPCRPYKTAVLKKMQPKNLRFSFNHGLKLKMKLKCKSTLYKYKSSLDLEDTINELVNV